MTNVKKKRTIPYIFNEKHRQYIKKCRDAEYNIAEGSIRAGKTVDHIYDFANSLKRTRDKLHLVTASTVAQAKLVISDSNGFGLEHIFRGQSRLGKYKQNEALIIKGPATGWKERIVIFAGGGKADSFKAIRGNSYGMWLATEINLHHNNTIKEAFNRTAAALDRKIYWDLNPDAPTHPIYEDHIDRYIKLGEDGVLNVNYEKFYIDDNPTMSPKRIADIKAQYLPGSVWFMRDILGLRVAAEGLIYDWFANHKKRYMFDRNKLTTPVVWQEIIVGVDYGGNGSKHAICVTGIRTNYTGVDVLRTERIEPGTAGQICKDILDIIKWCIKVHGVPSIVYADSAEVVLNNTLREYLNKHEYYIPVQGSRKIMINDRISLTQFLQSNYAITYREKDCKSLIVATETAVWDPKELVDMKRLDDGTTDIDSLDAFEYTIERYRKIFIDRVPIIVEKREIQKEVV